MAMAATVAPAGYQQHGLAQAGIFIYLFIYCAGNDSSSGGSRRVVSRASGIFLFLSLYTIVILGPLNVLKQRWQKTRV
jgi:hypothetical protein